MSHIDTLKGNSTIYGLKSTLGDFLEASAARKPTPGGGSVTALVGALACTMGEMCVHYSLGKKSLEAFAGELTPALEKLTRARQLLTQFMIEDQAAYDAVTLARKAPANDPEREARLDAALVACIRIPEGIAATAVSVLDLIEQITGFINPHLLSDLAVCADLAMATTRCAIYSVRANIAELKDPMDRAGVETTIRGLLSRAAEVIQRVAPRIWERHAQET